MNKRRNGYWVATGLLAADFGLAGAAAFFGAPFMRDAIEHLGYPRYFGLVLGAWKLLGAVAILVPGRGRLKEWAYAGMFFDLTAAVISHFAAGDAPAAAAPALVVLGLWAASWRLRPAGRDVLQGADLATRREPYATGALGDAG